MKLEGPGERLTIFIGESDQYGRKPLYVEIVERAHQAGLAGATVVRGFEGFGASSRIHTARILRMTEDLPVIVIIVDRIEKIDAFLPTLDELITEGLGAWVPGRPRAVPRVDRDVYGRYRHGFPRRVHDVLDAHVRDPSAL